VPTIASMLHISVTLGILCSKAASEDDGDEDGHSWHPKGHLRPGRALLSVPQLFLRTGGGRRCRTVRLATTTLTAASTEPLRAEKRLFVAPGLRSIFQKTAFPLCRLEAWVLNEELAGDMRANDSDL